jgi:hypothetical protein
MKNGDNGLRSPLQSTINVLGDRKQRSSHPELRRRPFRINEVYVLRRCLDTGDM